MIDMSNIERPIVAKFGGSSMADAESIKRVADIVRSDPNRCFVVVSAPGKNHTYTDKITDLLITASSFENTPKRATAFKQVSDRFSLIGQQLGVRETSRWVDQVWNGLNDRRHECEFEADADWCRSRGEWLIARIFASYLNATFIDAEDIIKIKNNGQADPVSYSLIRDRFINTSAVFVIPGYYGLDRFDQVRTFARGGSDVSGAIIAKGVNAQVYENWTDVNGILTADPRIVNKPSIVRNITYQEVRELGNRGFQVLQRDTILPLVEAGISINVRNTFNPQDSGTLIDVQRSQVLGEQVIGIAGEGPIVSFDIQKYGMNDEIGIGSRILEVFSALGMSFEHVPSGKDNVSVMLNQNQLNGDEPVVVRYLQDQVQPDSISVKRDLGLLTLVGQGIKGDAVDIAGRLFTRLGRNGIAVRAFSFGSFGISITTALDYGRLNEAIKLSHDLFIK